MFFFLINVVAVHHRSCFQIGCVVSQLTKISVSTISFGVKRTRNFFSSLFQASLRKNMRIQALVPKFTLAIVQRKESTQRRAFGLLVLFYGSTTVPTTTNRWSSCSNATTSPLKRYKPCNMTSTAIIVVLVLVPVSWTSITPGVVVVVVVVVATAAHDCKMLFVLAFGFYSEGVRVITPGRVARMILLGESSVVSRQSSFFYCSCGGEFRERNQRSGILAHSELLRWGGGQTRSRPRLDWTPRSKV